MDNTVNGSNELPSAYRISKGADGYYYPMRFGRWRIGSDGRRLSFFTWEKAVAYCRDEQRYYEQQYPAPSDTKPTPSLVNTSDPAEVEAHLRDSGDV